MRPPSMAAMAGLVAAAAEAVEAALAGLVAAEAAQRREHACVEAAFLLVAPLDVVGVGHLLPRRSVVHLGKG